MGFPLLSSFRSKLCPFCFEYFKMSETPFRCTSPPSKCAPDIDPVLSKVWQMNVPVGKVISTGGSLRSEVRCPDCLLTSTKRLCPHCHMELPQSIGEFKNYIFSIIGAKAAGKSHYLAVLIDHFRNTIGPETDILLSPANDHTINRYKRDFFDPVYVNKQPIVATQSGLINTSVRMPLIYTLLFSGRGMTGGTKITHGVTLVFFDTAGEDMDSQDVLATVNKYIYRSDGIVLLLDPLQLNGVRDKLPPTTGLPPINTETSTIIARTANLIREGRKYSQTKQIDTPLAVAFSKIDALEPILDDNSLLLSDSNHLDGFDVGDFEAVNDEIRSLLAQWDGQPILQQVSTFFKKSGFFGVSALGCNPHKDNRIPKVIPNRVADPFLWLLHNHGLFKKAI